MADPAAPPIPEAYLRADALIRELTADAEVGSKVRAKVKEKYPDVAFPEDRIDPVANALKEELEAERAARKALADEVAADKAARDEAQRAAAFRSQLEAARDKYRLTPEGYEMAIKRMTDEKSYDAEAAAAWAAMQNPVTKDPKQYLGPQAANFYGATDQDEAWADLHKNPERFVDKELSRFVSDPDEYVREAGFAI